MYYCLPNGKVVQSGEELLAYLAQANDGNSFSTTLSGPEDQGVFRIVSSVGTTNASVAKASAGNLYKITGFNGNAAARYLKLYNKASAPTVGTDTPFWTAYLPAQSDFSIDFSIPLYFSNGIALALTTGSADSDTGAVTAGDILGLNVSYS